MRKITDYVNASPQRAETFEAIQEQFGQRPKMLQNVKTRWNSTCLMLIRAILLQKALQHWFHTKDDVCITSLALHDQKWQQVHYIVQLIKLFALHGYTIGV